VLEETTNEKDLKDAVAVSLKLVCDRVQHSLVALPRMEIFEQYPLSFRKR
jgi:hypothetical protein